ncbi:MAG: glycosyltransferase family 9 protein [Minisyncoccia bacterium]
MKKVFIIREGALGDLILTFPVFFNFKKNGYKVFVGGKEIYKNFVEKYGFVDEFIPLDSSKYIFFFEKNSPELKEFLKNFELIISYTEENKIIGENLKRNFSKTIFFHPFRKENLSIHITDYLLEPVKKILKKNLYLSVNLNLKNEGEFFVVHPGSGSKFKNWDKENYLQLCKKLKNVKILLGPAENYDLKFWKENFKGEIIFSPSFDEIIEIAKRTIAYIGNDSGITHLFSITGIKTISIFGPTSPFIWGPRGENVKIVYKNVGCNPCSYEKMKSCTERKCLNFIKIDDILPLLENGKTGYI